MLRSGNPIEALPKAADRVALAVPADRLFSWRVRRFTPPPGWAAWVLRRDQDPILVEPGRSCESDGVTDVVFVRQAPVECVVEDTKLQSADGHEFCGRLRLPLRVILEPAELAAFRKTLLASQGALGRGDLERYVQWQARKVLVELVSRHPAEELLKPLDGAEVRRVVDQQLGAACLSGGLTVEGPAAVEFESSGYMDHRRRESELVRQQKEADARSQIQQALAAAQNQRLSHLIAMLEQMREASRQHGERTLMELLQAFGPAERGQMYGALWHLAPARRRTRYVAAVSGMELLLFDPADLRRPARRHPLPDSMGPLRSVRVDPQCLEAGVLLVGAATGVHVVDLETGRPLRALRAGAALDRPLRGGVNASGMSRDRILASHSELGIMSWPSQGPADSAARFHLPELTRRAETVRCLRVADSQAWVAVDERVLRFSADDPDGGEPIFYVGGRSAVSGLAVTREFVYAGTGDGRVLRWPLADPSDMAVVHRGSGLPVESVDVIDVGGVDWLVAADQQDALVASVLGDTHACRYLAGTARVRRAAVADDLFVAINDNRDRLIAWCPEKAAAPSSTVVVPYLTGSSIQDLCLV